MSDLYFELKSLFCLRCEGFFGELLDRLDRSPFLYAVFFDRFRYVQFCSFAAADIVKNKIKNKKCSLKRFREVFDCK